MLGTNSTIYPAVSKVSKYIYARHQKQSQDAAAVSRTNASLAPDRIVRGRGQVVAVLLEDCSTVAVLQQQKPDLPDVSDTL